MTWGTVGAQVGKGTNTCLSLGNANAVLSCVGSGTAWIDEAKAITWGPIPAGGVTISALTAVTSTNQAGGGATIDVLVNGTATVALSCTITAGTSTCANPSSASIPAGAFVQVRVTVAGNGIDKLGYRVSFKH